MKKLISLFCFFCAMLISCNKGNNHSIGFNQTIQYKEDTVFYTLDIKNITDKNLMVLVPNSYFKEKNCSQDHFITDAVEGIILPDFFCTDSAIVNLDSVTYFFSVYNQMDINDSLLQKKISGVIGNNVKNDIIAFLRPSQWNYPVLLCVKANSLVEYKYYTAGKFPKGTYLLKYDYPPEMTKSKKYKEWIKELKKISPVDNYSFYEIFSQKNESIQFEIK